MLIANVNSVSLHVSSAVVAYALAKPASCRNAFASHCSQGIVLPSTCCFFQLKMQTSTNAAFLSC